MGSDALKELREQAIIGEIQGYATVYNFLDSYETIFDPGCCARWLAERKAPTPLFYAHQLWGRVPIGYTTEIREDAIGLRYKANIINTAAGRETLTGVLAGAVNKTSITFRVLGEYKKDGVPHFSDIDVVEISPLVFAGNERTTCEAVSAEGLRRSVQDMTLIHTRGSVAPLLQAFAAELSRVTKEIFNAQG